MHRIFDRDYHHGGKEYKSRKGIEKYLFKHI
jgi:hypothetical protein